MSNKMSDVASSTWKGSPHDLTQCSMAWRTRDWTRGDLRLSLIRNLLHALVEKYLFACRGEGGGGGYGLGVRK
jgi:hypothetical protein